MQCKYKETQSEVKYERYLLVCRVYRLKSSAQVICDDRRKNISSLVFRVLGSNIEHKEHLVV